MENLLVATEFYRPIPQPHEPWTPVYVDFLSYKMAVGEAMPFWFQATATGPVPLTVTGTGSQYFGVQFYKPFGQTVDNSDAFKRASLALSPLSTYYDPLNPIPASTTVVPNNFAPEAAGVPEYVYLTLQVLASAPSGNYTLTMTLGSATVTMTIHVWANVVIPATPSRPFMVGMNVQNANFGINAKYIGDEQTIQAMQALTTVMIQNRATPYLNGIEYLAVEGSTLDIDATTQPGGSFREVTLNQVGSGIKFWNSQPQLDTDHRTAAYAAAAEATIAANGLTNMFLYVWDEPTSDTLTATAVKAILDAWHANSPSTKMFLTTSLGYENTAGAIAAGLNFATYGSQLVLGVVINTFGPSNPIASYTNGATGYYSGCEGNCGPLTNSNSTSGVDQGAVDFAYIDYPMVRKYAAYMLSLTSTYNPKIILMLHYDTCQAWSQFRGVLSDDSQNPWLSARRFNVMGDGTLAYPTVVGYKPHVGVPAFTTGGAVPSLRLLYIAHASYMADLFSAYLTAHSSYQANNLASSPTSFVTVYQTYESLRDQIGNAIEANTVISGTPDPIETVPPVIPPVTTPIPPGPPIVPPANPTNPTLPVVPPAPVVLPPPPPPPVIPQPPSTNPGSPPASPATGNPVLPTAIPATISGVSGLVAVLDTDVGQSYIALSNTLFKFSQFSAQYSLGVDASSYQQIKVNSQLSNKVLQFSGNLWQLPPMNSGLVDFFDNSSTAANYGNGTLTRTLTNSSISSKMLDLRGTAGAVRSAYYGSSITGAAGLCPLLQTGSIRQLVIPNYTGSPGIDSGAWDLVFYFSAQDNAANSGINQIRLAHSAAGNLVFTVTDSMGNSLSASGAWSPTAGGLYLIDATYDLNQGFLEIWVNGIFVANTIGIQTLSRSNTTAHVQLGWDNGTTSSGNHQVVGMTLFSTYRAWNKWEMMGTPVNERFNLTAYNIAWMPLSDEQKAYQGAGSDEGGANL